MITGLVLASLVVAALLIGDTAFLLLILAINQLALLEYQKLLVLSGYELQKFSLAIPGLLVVIFAWLIARGLAPTSLLLLLPLLVPVLLSVELFRKQQQPFVRVALSVLAVVWISAALALFLSAAYLPFPAGQYHSFLPLGYFIILWAGDSGAYVTGKTIGRRKLFPRISPKKTWEGSLGGLVCSWVAGLLDSLLFQQLQLSQWLLLALIIYISGSFGDFAKSMLKRSVGVKDSGNLLPGHGGILDRFDTLIGSAPFTFLYLLYYA